MARYNQRNGKWQVIIELGKDDRTGKRLRHTKDGFKTKKEAMAYATIKENELLNGVIPIKSKVLLKDFINNWYENHICNNNFSINTITNYKAVINTHIIPYMGNMQINKIKVIDVQNLYYDIVKNGLKPTNAKRVILVLRKCLLFAKKMNLISEVPCDIEFFKEVREKKIQYWNEDQLVYFLNEIKGTYLYLPVLLASFTGMRLGELCGLRYKNINLNNFRIEICEQTLNDKINKKLIHTDILKTSKSNRKITIPNFLAEEIKKNKHPNCTDNDFVLLNRDNEMWNPKNLSMYFTRNVRKHIYTPEDKAKKSKNEIKNYMQLPKITFHDLRHTHATILLLHGENIKVISERLGHESVKVTLDTYSHVLPSMEESTALLLDNIFKNKV